MFMRFETWLVLAVVIEVFHNFPQPIHVNTLHQATTRSLSLSKALHHPSVTWLVGHLAVLMADLGLTCSAVNCWLIVNC
jgi:hypothetical protein